MPRGSSAFSSAGAPYLRATLDKRVLQFKPGILIDREMCDEILNRLDSAVGQAQAELFGSRGQAQREAA